MGRGILSLTCASVCPSVRHFRFRNFSQQPARAFLRNATRSPGPVGGHSFFGRPYMVIMQSKIGGLSNLVLKHQKYCCTINESWRFTLLNLKGSGRGFIPSINWKNLIEKSWLYRTWLKWREPRFHSRQYTTGEPGPGPAKWRGEIPLSWEDHYKLFPHTKLRPQFVFQRVSTIMLFL
jgi:hypothetical protein